MMDFLNDLWVAEYSAEQKCFNVDILKNALAANAQMIVNKTNNDYLIFGIFKTAEEANAACDAMKRIQEKSKESIECQSHKD